MSEIRRSSRLHRCLHHRWSVCRRATFLAQRWCSGHRGDTWSIEGHDQQQHDCAESVQVRTFNRLHRPPCLIVDGLRYVIMDEADRMCDLGFEIDLNLILDSMPATFIKPDDSDALYGTTDFKGWRVTTLFSATMPASVERLSRKYLRKPAVVTIGDAGEAVDTVNQICEFISSDEKKKTRMIDILRNGGFAAPIVSGNFASALRHPIPPPSFVPIPCRV